MSQKHSHLVDYSKSAQDIWKLTLFSEPETTDKAMYRFRTSQLAKKILNVPAPWSVWNLERLYKLRRLRLDGDEFQCPCSYLKIVARVSPLFEGGLQNLAAVQAWYAQFHGPNMPSFDRVTEAVQGLTNDDIERLGSFRYLKKRGSLTSRGPRWEPVLQQSGYHELRLFTTHNGRLGFSTRGMEEGYEVRRFPGSDVALAHFFDKQEFEWSCARMLIINSDMSRNGYVPIQDPSYRYAIPDGEDIIAKCECVKDADLGEGTTVDTVQSSAVISHTFDIDQLQFWTW
jgi:hypothetical protein